MKTTRARKDRRSCSADFQICESTAPALGSFIPYIPHTARSQNPYCTALFCAVPRNRFFSSGIQSARFFIRGPSLAFPIWALGHPVQMSTFPPQVPAITLFNPFYPQLRIFTPSEHSTSFHQKSPVIPPIPLNSTYAVPPKLLISFFPSALGFIDSLAFGIWALCHSPQMLTFPSQVPETANSDRLNACAHVPGQMPLGTLGGICLSVRRRMHKLPPFFVFLLASSSAGSLA